MLLSPSLRSPTALPELQRPLEDRIYDVLDGAVAYLENPDNTQEILERSMAIANAVIVIVAKQD